MNRTRLATRLGPCAVALLPVLAFGTRFKVDTRLKLGGGYMSASGVDCGDREYIEAGYGALAAEARIQYGMFVASGAAALGAARYSEDTLSTKPGSWRLLPSGTLRLGLDGAWWSLEAGIALWSFEIFDWPLEIEDLPVLPSVRARLGPKVLAFTVGWFDTVPVGYYFPAWGKVLDWDDVAWQFVGLPALGFTSETDRWSAEVRFLPAAGANGMARFVWYLGRVGIGGEAAFASYGNLGRDTQDTGGLATYAYFIVAYRK